MVYLRKFLFAILVGGLLFSCSKDEENGNPNPEPPPEDMSGYARGADVSWLTEMESKGTLFYDANGKQTECMSLLKDLGMNSIRLRVWVNPTNGWCNKTDLLIKAKRAANLGMRVMVDFHYSDVWADPGHQTKPAEWNDLPFDELCTAVTDHTTEVLTALKNWDITPEWVQVGNETGNGMLWDDGKANVNMAQYALLNNCGYDATKAVFPDTKVIVHVQSGNDSNLFTWLFGGLKNNGGKWDVIGMSLYPETTNWLQYNNDCINNVNDLISRYNCEVMMCEIGMDWFEAETSYTFLNDFISRTKEIDDFLGTFYWEPQSYTGYNYQKGAFDLDGKPTKAMDAFAKD